MSFADHDDGGEPVGVRRSRNNGATTTNQSRANRERLGLDPQGPSRAKSRANGPTTASHSTQQQPQFVKQPIDIDDDPDIENGLDTTFSKSQISASSRIDPKQQQQQQQQHVLDQQEVQQLESARQLLATLTSNIKEIQRLSNLSKKAVEQIGSKKDTHDLRHRLNKNLESLTTVVRATAPLLKQLHDLSHLDDNIRQQHSVLKRQFEEETLHFRNLTEEASKKQKLTIRQVKAQTVNLERQAAIDKDEFSGVEAQEDDHLIEENPKRLEFLTLQNEISHNESIIAEREDDIREIEVTIREVNDIFRDLGVMVVAQGEDLDTIENLVSETKVKTEKATQELTKANKYQAAALGKMLLIIVIIIIVAIVATVAVVVFLKFFLSGFL